MTCCFIRAGFPNLILKPISCSMSVVVHGTTLMMQLSAGKAHQAVDRENWGGPCEEMQSQDPRGGREIGYGDKKKAVRTENWEWNSGWPPEQHMPRGWGVLISGIPGSIPEVHRQWKSHMLAILAGWVSHSSLGYSQKPTCNLRGVFTKCLCLKPLNLLIPRTEDTVFIWQAHCKDLILI